MKTILSLIFAALCIYSTSLSPILIAQVADQGCREFIEPPEDTELRWLTAALQRSGFQFTKEVRQAYIDYCLQKVAPDLRFSETTWDWLNHHPGVYSAAFSVEYPPKPQILHNFVKLALAISTKEQSEDGDGDTYASLEEALRYGGNASISTITDWSKVAKYQNFLMAVAIRYRNQWFPTDRLSLYTQKGSPLTKDALEKGVKAKGGWFLAEYTSAKIDLKSEDYDSHGHPNNDNALHLQARKNVNRNYDGMSAIETTITEWLRANPRTQVFSLMERGNAGELKKITGINCDNGTFKGINWTRIAHNAHRFPPRVYGSIAYNTILHIDRYEEGSKMGRKLFPLDSAPWPLLMMLAYEDPLDESTFFWSMFKAQNSVPGYATYTFAYTKPEVTLKDSSWNPNSSMRIIEDGGVCGRLSTMAEFAQRSIGTPACGMGQPGHRAFMTYNYDHATGRYAAVLHHSVDTIDVSTPGGWFLPPPMGASFNQETKITSFGPISGGSGINARWHFGLCEAINRGQTSYEDSRMIMNILQLYPEANDRQREAFLRSGLRINIANTDILFTLGKLYDGHANKIQRLITAFRNSVVKTDAGLTSQQKIKADQDLTRMLKDPHVNVRNTKKVTNEWGLFISNELFIGAFSTIPDVHSEKFEGTWAGEKIKAVQDYANAIKTELAYQKRIDKTSKYTGLVQDIFDKYEKTRLSINRVKTQNVRELRKEKEASKNSW